MADTDMPDTVMVDTGMADTVMVARLLPPPKGFSLRRR